MRWKAFLVVALVAGMLAPGAPARAETTVKIRGGGWGHGIGMSQYGAYGRAKNGKSASQILEHYYSGANVASVSIGSDIRVGLTQGRSSIAVGSTGKLVFKVGDSRIAAGDGSTDWTLEPSSTGGVRVFKNGNRVRRDGKGVFGGPSTPISANYKKFGSHISISGKSPTYSRGKALFGTYSSDICDAGYCLRGLLSMSMQEYLYGLGEVPSSWPGAVLRAQAIAGRTYAYAKMLASPTGRYPCDCHVYDSVVDQAYIGDSKETSYFEEWKAAVDDTNNKVVKHDGAPIQALYSSSSGGHTENNENVWGGTPIPYLRGVNDGPDDNAANPNHTWSVEMSYSSFESKLNSAYGTGKLEEFKLVRPFGVSGRVTVVKDSGGGARIVGSNKTARVSGWSLRSALALKDTLFRVDISFPVSERFLPKYRRLDGAPGSPTGKSYAVPVGWDRSRGRAQNFEIGRMTYTRSVDKVVWQHGPVLKKYNALGREKSSLRMPTSDIWGTNAYSGGSYLNGIILWSPETDAHSIRGSFRSAYGQAGGPKGVLGLPTKQREKRASLPNGGARQRFQAGTLYLNPKSAEVFALWGALDERYRKIGEASSNCGYPTSSVSDDSVTQRVTFQHGSMEATATGVTVDCG
jgi:SpoIID/LytB domain protein